MRSRILGTDYSPSEFAKDDITYGSIDWNLRISSFEEGGTDVGMQSQKSSSNSAPDRSLG